MRYLIGFIGVILLIACGCSSGPTNGTSNLNPPIPTAVFTPGGLGLFDGEPAQLAVNITNGTPPFTIAINMGGGADNVPAGTAVDAASTNNFTLSEGGPYPYTVTVTDSRGQTGIATGNYGPVGPAQNHAPTITDIAFDGGILAVMVDDPDGDDPLTVSVGEVPGLIPGTLSQQVANKGAALFNYRLLDGFDPDGLAVRVRVSDGQSSFDMPVTPSGTLPRVEIPEGHLIAVPMRREVSLDDHATVLVMTGPFPDDAPFNYMNGVGLTMNEGVRFEGFNIGSLGGEEYDIDGIWATMDPLPQTFFLPHMFWQQFAIIDHPSFPGLEFLGANITPIGAGQVTNGGDLFNVEVSFEHPGVYDIGFISFYDVKRTYYSDTLATEHSWVDVSNDQPGLPNSIYVYEPENRAPQIMEAVFNNSELHVRVSDQNAGDTLTVSFADHSALLPDTTVITLGSEGTAVFNCLAYSAPDPYFDPVAVTVSDGVNERTTMVTPPVSIPVVEIGLSQIVAFPLKTAARVGEPVPIVVATGPFPEYAPFQHMSGVAITCLDGFRQSQDTINVGAIGGERLGADGIWARMDPVPTHFFIPENFMWFWPADVTADSSLDYISFHISVPAGSEITEGGVLYNCPFTFQAAGTYRLGFLEFQDVKRTYYMDGDGTEHNWKDITNTHPELPNTITVVE